MIMKFVNWMFISRKNIILILIALVINSLPVSAQVIYVPTDERSDTEMGVERVARLFTATYESKLAQSDKEIRWIQIDLGAREKIDGIKLLPKVAVWGYVSSVGFPSRFRIE